MNVTRRPDPVQRSQIESRSHTTSFMCWTCGSCDFECPVNIATGRLRPQKLVRLATLGLVEELLEQPEIVAQRVQSASTDYPEHHSTFSGSA